MIISEQVVAAIQNTVGSASIPLHAPIFAGNEWVYLKECLDSTYVSSVGKFVDRFEADLAAYVGSKHAIAVMNGTAALHLSLVLGGVKADDEVLIPALSFVATANAVKYCQAIPHFVDSDERTLGMNQDALYDYLKTITKLESGVCVNQTTGRVIRAMLPMHTFGHPVDVDGLLKVAHDFKLIMIEDAAESLGSFYQGKHTGTFGLMGAFSFNGNKIATTGGGGAIVTDDANIAKRAKHISTTAKVAHQWDFVHDEIGYNYRMPNINATLGCAQLESLPQFLATKRQLQTGYHHAFSDIDQINIFKEPEGCESNYWLQVLLLDKNLAHEREAILTATNQAGLMTRPVWRLLNRLLPYQDSPKMPLPVAESLEKRIINLPSSANLNTHV
ncbi:MAG: LegC family aminotransferase [Legionella sp.]|nr:LegC family aminotransferase [Legionella sp.]